MTTLAVELHDAGISAGSDRGRPSPGYALIDGDSLLVGTEALERARLKPRRVCNRFWSELDTKPLERPLPPELSHADLAHAHLSRFWSRVGTGVEQVLLAVPGSHDERRLGLILGIARACAMPVVGLVDAALAAAVGQEAREHLLHVDLQLHCSVVTELTRDTQLVRRQVRIADQGGLAALHDTWAKAIAESFVRGARFDPLHDAATEQGLYLRLPQLLERLCADEPVVAELASGDRVHRVELSRRRIEDAAGRRYAAIVQLVQQLEPLGRHTTLLLSHRVAGLPGLARRLAEIGDAEVVELSPDAATRGALALEHRVRSEDEALPFVTRVAAEAAPRVRPPRAERPGPSVSDGAQREQPTHVLHDARAFPITDEPFLFGLALPDGRAGYRLSGETAGISRTHCSVYRSGGRVVVEDHSTHGSFLNGQRVVGRAGLAAGDRLRLGSPGIELRLIREVGPDGPA